MCWLFTLQILNALKCKVPALCASKCELRVVPFGLESRRPFTNQSIGLYLKSTNSHPQAFYNAFTTKREFNEVRQPYFYSFIFLHLFLKWTPRCSSTHFQDQILRNVFLNLSPSAHFHIRFYCMRRSFAMNSSGWIIVVLNSHIDAGEIIQTSGPKHTWT